MSSANGGRTVKSWPGARVVRALKRRPRRAWNDLRLRGKGRVLVAIPLLVFAVSAVLFAFTVASDGNAERAARQSERVQQRIAAVGTAIDTRQSDHRGYVALGSSELLTVVGADEVALGLALDALHEAVKDDSVQHQLADSVRGIVRAVPPLPAPLTSTTSRSPIESDVVAAARAWMVSENATTAEAKRVLSQMNRTAEELVGQHRLVADRWRVVAGISVGALLVVGFIGGLIGARIFSRSVARRVEKLDAELTDLDHEPAESPDDSADELGVVARRLRTAADALRVREAELQEARAFLESVVTVGPVVVLRVADTRATYVSANCERVLGIPLSDAMSQEYWRGVMSTQERDRYYAAVSHLFESDGPRVVDFEGAYQIGGRVRYLSSLVTRESRDDANDAVLVYMLDVTDRRIAEREVARQQRELSAITAASPDTILVVAPDLRITFVSDAVTADVARQPANLIGKVVGSLMHDDDRPKFIDAVRAITTGAVDEFTLRVRSRRANNEWRTAEVRGRPLLGDAGEPTAAVMIMRDITDRMALEAALVDARDVADAASHAKSEFLSRMSHELRTPLNVVLGFSQLLQLEPLSTEQESWVEQVLKAGRHLLDLINEVLDISRIESGGLTLSVEAVSMRELVGETVESLRPIAAPDVTLAFTVKGDDVFALADRQRLKQVLLNLVTNAIKYNRPQGTVTITSELTDLDFAEIRITDTGIGIAPEHIDRLFVPFDRLGFEHSLIEGTGVGLALSLLLVEAMGGTLSVTSSLGEGSTFTVRLPVAGRPLEPMREQAHTVSEWYSIIPASPPAKGTIVYIEDHDANVALMKRVVARRPGLKLLHATTGRAGIELARTNHARLILLDLHLPDVPGIELLDQLRADPATSHVPVYVVSADATVEQVLLARSAGAVGFLTKPLDIHRLLELFDRELGTESTPGEGD